MNKLLVALFCVATLSGCVQEETDEPEPEPWMAPDIKPEPSYGNPQPASVTGLQQVGRLSYADGGFFPSGSGIWPYGDYVYGSALGNGFFIADISDPANPVMVFNATVDSEQANNTVTSFSRDADVIHHADGRLTLVLATQSNGMHFWNVTDPANPEFASVLSEIGANHNVAVIPSTELVFNSQSGGAGKTNEIVDASDPYNPFVLGTFGTHGCHDISFFGDLNTSHEESDPFRAYCAGIQRTEIWNMDGFDPATGTGITLVSTIDFADDPTSSPVIGNPAFQSYPLRTLHHLAMVNEDASVLIIGDEQNGGGEPGACYAYDETTGASTPFGALWFYDLSDEVNPVLRGWISPPTIVPEANPTTPDPGVIDPNNPSGIVNALRPYTEGVPNCTAHFGSIVPGEEKLVMAWYSAGVILLDFSDITNPRIIDQYQPDPTNPWDARIHGGYVYTGDIVRGMEVLQLI